MPYVIVLKGHSHHLTKYEDKAIKISMIKIFSELENLEMQSRLFKNPNFPSLYGLRKTWKYTQPQTNISKSKCSIYG